MTTTDTPTAPELVDVIYRTARTISRERRAELAGELDRFTPGPVPTRGRGDRAAVVRYVTRAGRRLVAQAAGPDAGLVRIAVANLVRAVKELAEFVPSYSEAELLVRANSSWEAVYEPGEVVAGYVALGESAAELDALRGRVFVALVELDELLRGHPDQFARLAAVVQRLAVKLLPTRDAERVGAWFGRVAGSL